MEIKDAISNAERLKSNLPTRVVSALKGMSSPRIWHLLNNLVQGSYLEVGVWKGSTLIAALYGKDLPATAIDNFSQFGGPKEEFLDNLVEYEIFTNFFNGDCFSDKIIEQVPSGIQYYFYDGGHTEQDQYNALVKYVDKMADEFVYIVDDWNEKSVQQGTLRAIDETGVFIQEFHELKTPKNGHKETWWNGIAIFRFKRYIN